MKSWYEHPVYVAAVAVAGTIGLSVLIYKEVLLPSHLAASQFQIESLERQLSECTSGSAATDNALSECKRAGEQEKEAFESVIKESRSELELAQAQLKELIMGSLFLNSSPYPVTLEDVRAGDPLDVLREKRPSAHPIEKEDGYWSLEVDHPYFQYVTYYFDDKPGSPIYQIYYRAKHLTPVSENFLQTQLVRTLGTPISFPKEHYIWLLPHGLLVYKSEPDAYIVAREGVVPGGWDRVLQRALDSIKAEIPSSSGPKDPE